jgi:hypothetical protein
MTIQHLIREVVDKAYEDGVDINSQWISEQIETLYPVEFTEYMLPQARKGIKSEAKRYLEKLSNTKQEALPGFEIPAWLSVPDGEGGHVKRPARVATLKDHALDLESRAENLRHIQREFDAASQRNSRLWSVPKAHDDMLISDAVALLKAQQTDEDDAEL